MNNGSKEKAKRCFLEALKIDARCFEAFKSLLENYLISVTEETELIDSLALQGANSFEFNFLKALYTSKLTKV